MSLILDIEMPDLDGIAALPLMLASKRDLVVIMASTLTHRNAEISFKALSLGAADYIPKPESAREIAAAETFRRDLIEKIRHLGARRRGIKACAAARRSCRAGCCAPPLDAVAHPVAQSPMLRVRSADTLPRAC